MIGALHPLMPSSPHLEIISAMSSFFSAKDVADTACSETSRVHPRVACSLRRRQHPAFTSSSCIPHVGEELRLGRPRLGSWAFYNHMNRMLMSPLLGLLFTDSVLLTRKGPPYRQVPPAAKWLEQQPCSSDDLAGARLSTLRQRAQSDARSRQRTPDSLQALTHYRRPQRISPHNDENVTVIFCPLVALVVQVWSGLR